MEHRPAIERISMIAHRRAATMLMLLFSSLVGCSSDENDAADSQISDDTDALYSGNFVVRNENDKTIRIANLVSWESFGDKQLFEGVLAHGAESESNYPQSVWFPESTYIAWTFEDDPAVTLTQSIDLKGVVPANTEGRTEIIFGADGTWTARFTPGEFGHASSDTEVFYSGVFEVTNKTDATLIIQNWENFGGARPAEGFIVPGDGVKGSHFPNLSRFPDSTVVSWVVAEGDPLEDEQNGPVHSQTIDLTGVVPTNTEGYTEFIFSADGTWTVRFVPEGEVATAPFQVHRPPDTQIPRDPDPFYSGAFAVTNDSRRTIVIQDWENFDGLHPANGGYPSRFQVAGADVLKLDHFPDSTVVTWYFNDDPNYIIHSQTIDLTGVVPPNTEGRTEFFFSEDEEWIVRFLREPD